VTLLIALCAAAVYGVATALQQHEASSTPLELGLRPGLLARLVRRPVWLIGLAGDVVGFALQATALAIGSLVVVQPTLATNLIFGLAVTALLTRSRLTPSQIKSAVAVVVGLAAFLVVAQPTARSHAQAAAHAWVLLVIVVGGLALVGVVIGSSAHGRRRGVALGLSASAAETLMAVVAKAFGERIGHGVPAALRSWEPYAVIGCGLATLLIVQSAYQVGLPMLVLPVHAVGEPLLGVAVGIGLFGEHVHLKAWRGPVVVGALALLAAGLVVFTRATAPLAEPIRPSVQGAQQ
jgi:drug/metabolite transporter (DMT)-like permease